MNVSIRAGHALRTPYRFPERTSEPERPEAAEASSERAFQPLILTVDIEATARAHRQAAFSGLLPRWLRKVRKWRQ